MTRKAQGNTFARHFISRFEIHLAFGLPWQAAVIFLLSIVGATNGTQPANISYLVGISDGKCIPTGCEWWRHDSVHHKDDLILRLKSPPYPAGWTADMSTVYFYTNDGIYQANWKPNTEPVKVASMPVAVDDISDLWIEKDSLRWRLISVPPAETDPVTSAWELASDGKWRPLKRQNAACNPSQTDCGATIHDLDHRTHALWFTEIAEAMLLRSCFAAPETLQSAELQDVLQSASDRMLIINADMGDTWHATAPLLLQHRNGKPVATLIPDHRDQEHPYSRQLQLMESGGLLLVGDEYEGTNSVLFNLQSGAVVYRFPPTAHEVIWIEKPTIHKLQN